MVKRTDLTKKTHAEFGFWERVPANGPVEKYVGSFATDMPDAQSHAKGTAVHLHHAGIIDSPNPRYHGGYLYIEITKPEGIEKFERMGRFPLLLRPYINGIDNTRKIMSELTPLPAHEAREKIEALPWIGLEAGYKSAGIGVDVYDPVEAYQIADHLHKKGLIDGRAFHTIEDAVVLMLLRRENDPPPFRITVDEGHANEFVKQFPNAGTVQGKWTGGEAARKDSGLDSPSRN